MNRRTFLRALGLGAATVAAAPYLPALVRAVPVPQAAAGFSGVLTFRGVPLVYDALCAPSRVYFINPRYFRSSASRPCSA